MGIRRNIKKLTGYLNLINGLNKNFNFFDSLRIFIGLRFNKNTISVKSKKIKIYFRNNTKDKETFLEIFKDEIYNTPYFFEPKNIIDAGANVGYFSLLFKIRYPKASIVAIEIDDENINYAKKNTSSFSDVEILKKGLYNKKTTLKVEDPYNATNSYQVRELTSREKNSIESITIDEIIAEKKWDYIDILKIDIEGAELNLFSSNYDKWLPKVKILFIETHDRMIKGCSKSVTSALNEFDQFVLYTTTIGTLVYYNSDLIKIP